jgi:hypothetical protein
VFFEKTIFSCGKPTICPCGARHTENEKLQFLKRRRDRKPFFFKN